ncbi:two-component system, NtrC family, response regulator HydG [Algoriphagus alkaliphilus]|uniref:Two-component system, NtrC family, response regulator HydG n=1 Tax=Algoriphagus alkaliphilus TaxID=279824 RepID=A0A1G5XW90_9BACT|nr:sigma-54 dependent transcriptional regulator [Algoriphagus alkaliphilus]MBA4299122.1 sigma-54-dependent Fis family transcriptional regulator [Cyclobacterium sp.]SDA74124.1 two-component system, NtrC family, response regulator HydG [Algoriphagus alkaliphilus]
MAHILVIDDNLDICQLLDRFLTKKGHNVQTTISGKTGLDYIKKMKYDLIFCDFKLREMDGREILQKVKEVSPNTQVVIITGYADVKIAVEVIKNGAFDYITKPLIPDEILLLIDRCMLAKKESHSYSVNFLRPNDMGNSSNSSTNLPKDNYLRGIGKESRKLYKEVQLVAPTNLSVVIYGESGAGKENIAKIIHEQSSRAGKPFIAIDCGALTKELAGSELWGHEKGAFTGAHSDKAGQFELADGGTIFLDEISNLSYEIQVGLLRLVQERKLRRIGASKDRSIDVRILVASNEDLRKSVQEGKFREDLFFRFNEFSITVPPLRERKDDIAAFSKHFLELANEELNKDLVGFDPDVLDVFLNYDWPGNLREMRNVIRRAILLSNGRTISLSGLPPEVVYFRKFNFKELDEDDPQLETVRNDSYSSLKNAAAGAEAAILRKVLEEVKYNRTKAAQRLGIDRKTLFNKMKQYDL